eukprot:SAG11_NODE_10670_length_813_cov_0.866947_2_plen_40_part_01
MRVSLAMVSLAMMSLAMVRLRFQSPWVATTGRRTTQRSHS